MAAQTGGGLARLTIATPDRRIDLVLPEQVPLAQLIPAVLQHIDPRKSSSTGQRAAVGWELRRSDGSRLSTDGTLASQGVRDGELLHVASLSDGWPEPDYDDVVLAISDSAARSASFWTGDDTRSAVLWSAAVVAAVGLPLLLLAGTPWTLPAVVAFVVAAAAVAAGATLSRVSGDSVAGGYVGALALPYAMVGGLILLAGSKPLSVLGAPQALVAFAALIFAAVAGYFMVGDLPRIYVAAAVIGLLGLVGALLTIAGMRPVGSVAVAASLGLLFMPSAAVLSVWLAKLPMPDLPQNAEDLLADKPLPARAQVLVAVARADEYFSGLLLGLSVVVAGCAILLVRDGGVAPMILAGVLAALLLLRSRSVVRSRQRLPLLITGLATAAFVTAVLALRGSPATLPVIVLLAVTPVALVVVFLGLRYVRQRPGPRVSRLADLSEIMLNLSVVPLVVAVLGLYGYVRGLGG